MHSIVEIVVGIISVVAAFGIGFGPLKTHPLGIRSFYTILLVASGLVSIADGLFDRVI